VGSDPEGALTAIGGRVASIVIGGWVVRRHIREILVTARAADADPDIFRLRIVASIQAAGRPRWMVRLWERNFQRVIRETGSAKPER
jgi:hypothetical protein